MELPGVEYYEIRVDNRAGTRQALINSTATESVLLSGEFVINKIHGCGMFRFDVAPENLQGTIEMADIVEVWAKPVGGSLTQYYTGTVITVPSAASTALVHRYEAVGLWYQVERQTITKFYEGDTIDDLIEFILGDIDGPTDSDIDNTTSEIVVGSPYTLADFEADNMSAAEAIELLAQVQGSIQYGVDQEGKLYFKDESTSVVHHAFLGKHLESFEPRTESAKVVNRLIMQGRTIISGGNLVLVRDQTAGDHRIAFIGVRDKLVAVPQLSDPGDVWRWAEKRLTESGFKTIVDTKLLNIYDFIFPRGRVRVVNGNGQEYEFDIQQVTYKFDSEGGMSGEIVIGDQPADDIADQFRDIDRDIRLSKSAAVSLTRIDHTRGEEWKQKVIVDARQNSNMNHFVNTFENTKALNLEVCYNMKHDSRRKYVGCPPAQSKAYVQTTVIPCGQQVDTIRVHADCDFKGWIGFEADEDLKDFFDQDGANTWRIVNGKSAIDAIGSGTVELFYTDFGLPVNYGLWLHIIYAGGTQGYWLWDYVDLNNYNYFATNYNFAWLGQRLGGVHTGVGGSLGGSFVEQYIWLQARTTPTASVLKVYDANLNLLRTDNFVMPATAGRPGAFYNTAFTNWEIDEFEFLEIGDIDIWISRDGGTTWTQATITHGENNTDVDVSGQPAGTDIVIKAELYHPARLYGWGFSFQN